MDGCLCGNWIDADLSSSTRECEIIAERKRKDLQTLLSELEEIKQNLEHIKEKQQFLDDLMMKFYGIEPQEN